MVMKTFRHMQRQGKTIVLITHGAEVAAWADRVVYIRDGRLMSAEEERAFETRLAEREATLQREAIA